MCANNVNSDCGLVSTQCSLAVTGAWTTDTVNINFAYPADEVQKEENFGNINCHWLRTTLPFFPPCVTVIGQRNCFISDTFFTPYFRIPATLWSSWTWRYYFVL